MGQAHQRALQGDVEQLHVQARVHGAELGLGIEVDAGELAAFCVVGHGAGSGGG